MFRPLIGYPQYVKIQKIKITFPTKVSYKYSST